MFYIGKRNNPKFPQPYYKAFGKLTKKEAAAKKERPSYGFMGLTSYRTIDAYEAAIAELVAEGQRVL